MTWYETLHNYLEQAVVQVGLGHVRQRPALPALQLAQAPKLLGFGAMRGGVAGSASPSRDGAAFYHRRNSSSGISM